MKTNQDFKNASLAALKGNWPKAVLATVIYIAITLFCEGPSQFFALKNPTLGEDIASMTAYGDMAGFAGMYANLMRYSGLSLLLMIFLYIPTTVGFNNAFVSLLRTGDNDLPANTFNLGFKNYFHKVWGIVLMYIFIYLWMLLLIIPGIIKIFSYAMTPYTLEDNPELSANEAIDRSRAMMKGHKFDLFWLLLSFIGWFLLSFLTLGIGFLWLIPYVEGATAAFYEEVKADYELNGGLI